MAWISVKGEARAEGLLKEAYERVRRALGALQASQGGHRSRPEGLGVEPEP